MNTVLHEEIKKLATARRSLPQDLAIQFIPGIIATGDGTQWKNGYIHGLIQAMIMAVVITSVQACKLEYEQMQASYTPLVTMRQGVQHEL
jgi:hypothetical protein